MIIAHIVFSKKVCYYKIILNITVRFQRINDKLTRRLQRISTQDESHEYRCARQYEKSRPDY